MKSVRLYLAGLIFRNWLALPSKILDWRWIRQFRKNQSISRANSLVLVLLINLFSAGSSVADTSNSEICSTNQKKQRLAVNAVKKTAEYKKIEQQNRADAKIVFGPTDIDKPVFWNNECYWSVTVYMNRSDRLELRSAFRISQTMNRIYQQNVDGDFVNLKKPNGVK